MVAKRDGKLEHKAQDRARDEDDEIDELIARVDAGESIWSDDDEVITLEVKRPLDKVIPVRLASAHWDALYGEARELGVGPTTLARMWILEKLRTLPARAAPRKRASGPVAAPGTRAPASSAAAARNRAPASPAAGSRKRGTAAKRKRPA